MAPRSRAARSASRLRALLPGPDDLSDARRSPRHDVVAGITVAIVALPLALAFGVSSGLGAEAGLATAIVGGAIAAIFGGSNLQVSGPTGAMTVVLIPVVHRFGVDGALTVGLMAGVVLIGLALMRVGGYVQLLPLPVIEGFTAGIAAVIALQQLPAALGVETQAHGARITTIAFDAVRSFAAHPAVPSIALAFGVAALMLTGARWRPGLPFSLFGVAIATVVASVAGLHVATIGALPATLPMPSLGFLDLGTVPSLVPSALAIAALAALESLLSATVADGMTVNERHDPNRELFGQGLANLAVPLVGGVPTTAAIARTAVNVRAGARSRTAALTHALVLAAVVAVAAPLVGHIPLAALAGVLLATTVRMVDLGAIRALLRSTPRDAAVLLTTFGVTVAFDLVTAVGVGVVLAGFLALRAIAQSTTMPQVPIDRGDHGEEQQALLRDRIVAFRPEGPLFFGAAQRFLMDLVDVGDVEVVILRLSRVSTMDATGASILGDAIEHLERRGIAVVLSGIDDEHAELLRTFGAASELDARGRVFATTPEAIAWARAHVLGAAQQRPEVAQPPRGAAASEPVGLA